MTLRALRVDFLPSDLERFRAAVVQKIGLQFDDAKLGFLGEVLQRRLDRHACSGAHYLRKLENGTGRDELRALAQELTVGETYFFRHNDQFRAFAEVALPERMRAREATRTLQILSAGCASGEEAYSLAIIARETVTDPTWQIQIRAVDLNPAALKKATTGRYSQWALRETPPDVQRKWFNFDGRDAVLDQKVRAAVQFDERNLAGDDPELWQPAAYDVIFCRNVLMYFAPEQMRAVIRRFAEALAPGGYLFLGHAETLRGISEAFHICHTHGTFYYQRKAHLEAAVGTTLGAAVETPRAAIIQTGRGNGAAAVTRTDILPAAALGADWVDIIRLASERVAALVSAADAANTPAPPRATAWKLAPVFDLLRHERFGEALDYVRGGPPEAAGDLDVLLVRAVLLAQDGQLAAAQDACRQLLQIDDLNAGAHYVLALGHEHAGAYERALEHDRLAAHLDPTFAMPRLHCGLMKRRAGDRDGARRELAQALLLLKREDVSRLLLFGGGFARDALIAVCQSAIADCEARS